MNENINLCELLKGHEGETFYSPICGDITFREINYDLENPIRTNRFNLSQEGKWNKEGEIMIFPSKDQRDWNKWAVEQKPKTPKTWKELCQSAQVEQIEVSTDVIFDDNDKMIDNSHAVGRNNKLAKSALALLEIRQLIEVGYGGNVTNEEWEDDSMLKYTIKAYCNNIVSRQTYVINTPVAFHTLQQRDEFLSYPENVQLVKDFYME